MAAALPPGLIRVTSATETEAPSDPAEFTYERQRALHNFWKVHNAQSRATRDVSSIRCRQLFWRVWGDSRLSTRLTQDTMLRLWLQCQRDFDMTPIQLRDAHPSAFNQDFDRELNDQPLPKNSLGSQSSASVSPSQILLGNHSVEDSAGDSQTSERRSQGSKRSSRTSDSKPGLARRPSSDAGRKRSNITANPARLRTRPSITRKRSSQTAQTPGTDKTRRSIIKSPSTSAQDDSITVNQPDSKPQIVQGSAISSNALDGLSNRRISAFELPSASSWQSLESHDLQQRPLDPIVADPTTVLEVDKNFREKFVETQNYLRSSTNLANMQKAIRKTGSVVRFADEVDVPENFRMSGWADGPKNTTPHRTASEGQKPQGNSSDQPWHPKRLERHDSTGSVAAVSDDGEEEDKEEEYIAENVIAPLPRTRSQLSLGIAVLRRSQSLGEQEAAGDSHSVTSPQIEKEQEALISGKKMRKSNEEEDNLLAMGRKDGVTRAGGVNLPKELTVKGKFILGDGFESPEEPLY